MTVPFGGGHYTTAAKIADILQARDASLEVEILDVITDGWPAFARRSSAAYQDSTSSHNAFWFKVYYKFTDRFPQPLRWFASAAFRGYARRKLSELKPDLMIATFPFLGHVAARARTRAGWHMPVVTVITDAGRVQGIWLTGKEDAILAATPDTVEYAKARRMAAERVKFVGFPINRAFYELEPQSQARRALGLKPEVFTILLTSGGLGMSAGKAVSLLKRLARLRVPVQIICVAGKNTHLQAEFEAITFPDNITPLVIGYTDSMPRLMAACDIVVSKSGWLTLSEALAARKPLFLFDAIPGHEEQNALHITEGGFGIYEPDTVAMYQRISTVIAHPEQLEPHLAALARDGNPAGADRLADYFLGLLNGHPV